MRRCAAVVAVLALSLPPAAVVAQEPADIGERVLACAPCHGATGEGSRDPYFPRLAGKPAGYLFNQLVAFRDGRRRFPPMNYLLEYLPSEYLKDIATYFADQHPPLPTLGAPDVSDEVLKQGQALVTQGDAGRAIPACSSCHGPNLTGMEPGIPGLLPDCMQGVAARLTEADVRALAAYLATLPAPLDSAPATQGAYALPFACGSESTR
jgi:cytochrome c553